MRFQRHISESNSFITVEDVKQIKNECKEFFYKSRFLKVNYKLYRRTRKNIKTLIPVIPRKNRLPLDTPKEVHNELDKLFKKEFGWKVRSEGVFCSGNPPPNTYGQLYYMFPVGNFKYIWSPEIRDLTVELNNMEIIKSYGDDFYPNYLDFDDTVKEKLEMIINEYQDNDFLKALSSGKEISIKCKKYYMLKDIDVESHADIYTELFRGDLP